MQCDTEVPENLRSKIINFPPLFKNTLVSKSDIGELMKDEAEEERLSSQPRKMLISSFTLHYGTLVVRVLAEQTGDGGGGGGRPYVLR